MSDTTKTPPEDTPESSQKRQQKPQQKPHFDPHFGDDVDDFAPASGDGKPTKPPSF